MLSNVLIDLSIYFSVFSICLLIGHVFYSLFVPNIRLPYQQTFVKSIIGIILFILMISFYHTLGKTILILFLLILLFFIYEKQLHLKKGGLRELVKIPSKKEFLFYLTSVFLPGTVFFIWEAIFTFKTGTFSYSISPSDFQHYSEISSALSTSGQENIFGAKNLLMDDYLGNTPYHYFELWFNNGVSNIFNTINIVTLMSVTYPIFYWVAYIGICSIWESYNNVSVSQKILSILFLGLGGIFFMFYKQIPYLGAGQLLCAVPLDTYYRKFIIYYPFTIAAFLFFRYNKINYAIVSILCLPIISIGSFPGIITSIILFVLVEKKIEKSLDKKKMLLFVLIFTFFTAAFYLIMKKPIVVVNNLSTIFSIDYWTQSNTYKTIFNIYVLTTAQVILYYFPFFFLIYIFTNNKIRSLKKIPSPVIYLILLYITSLSSWAFLHATGNARQFFSNGLNVLLITWIIAYLIKLIVETKFNKPLVICISLLLFVNIYHSFDNNYKTKINFQTDKYLETISIEINKIKANLIYGAIIFSSEEIATITQRRNKAFHIYPLAHYTNYFKKEIDVQNLSIYDAPRLKDKQNEKRFKHLIEITPFYRFVENQKKMKQFDSIEISQLDFIKKFKIKFIILRKGVVRPIYLNKIFKKEIIDEKSGDRFIILKTN